MKSAYFRTHSQQLNTVASTSGLDIWSTGQNTLTAFVKQLDALICPSRETVLSVYVTANADERKQDNMWSSDSWCFLSWSSRHKHISCSSLTWLGFAMLLKELFMRSFKILKQHWWFYPGKKVKLHRQNIEMPWHGSKLPWSAPKITLYMCRQISGNRCVTSMLKRQTSQYTQTVRYISCCKEEDNSGSKRVNTVTLKCGHSYLVVHACWHVPSGKPLASVGMANHLLLNCLLHVLYCKCCYSEVSYANVKKSGN